MKIKTIEIYGFGKWNNVTFDLEQKLQIFYGLNEAGKSTLRQFIYSVLFGFAGARGSSKYLQYKPKKAKGSGSYGGVLTVEHEKQIYQIERVKGKNGGQVTIKKLADNLEMPTAFLNEILGPVDQNTYERLLGFNQSDLDDFNDLGNRDDLRRHILRMGAVGSDEWIKLERDLKKEAAKMYTVSSRSRELDRKLASYQTAMQQLQADKAKFPDYQSAKALEDTSDEQLSITRQKITQKDQELATTTKMLDVLPAYTEIMDLRKQLAMVPEANLKLDLNQVEVLAKQIKLNQATIENLQRQIAERSVTNPTDVNVEKLQKLQGRLPEAKLNYGQLADLNKRIQRLNAQIDEIKQQYGEKIEQLVPMSETQFNQFKDLALQQKRTEAELNQIKNQMLETARRHPQGADQNSNVVLGMVAVLAIIDFLLPLSLIFKIVILAGILGAGYLTMKSKEDPEEPGLADELKQNETKLEQINQELQQIGRQTGFEIVPREEWSALQNSLLNLVHLQNEIGDLKQHLISVTMQLEDFWQLSDQIFPKMGEHQHQLLDKVAEQTNRQLQATQDAQEVLQQREILTQNLQEKQMELKSLQNQLADFKVPELNAEFENWLAEVRRQQQQQLRLKSLEDSIPSQQLADLETQEDLEGLQQLKLEQTSQLTELKAKEQAILDQRSDQIGEMTGLKNSVDLLVEQQQLAELATEIKDTVAKWLTIQLGAEWVDQTLGVATKGRLPVIIEAANQLFSQITNQRYQSVTFDQDDMIRVTDNKGDTFEIGELSKGTMEQLYIAIRFAFMQAFADTVNLPIIIDDAFVAFDHERLHQVFSLLQKMAGQTQIIYFSAKKEVYDLVEPTKIIDLNQK
jgi:uncharacterized protein YhaN